MHVAVTIVAAPRRTVMIDKYHRQVLDVEDQSETEQQDHDHRNDECQAEINRIAQQFACFLGSDGRYAVKHGGSRPGR